MEARESKMDQLLKAANTGRLFLHLTALAVLLTIICAGNTALAGESFAPVLLYTGEEELMVSPYLEILEDKPGTLDLTQVIGERNNDFRTSRWEIPNEGLTQSVYWARFTLKNATPETAGLLLSFNYPCTDYVGLYQPDPEGGYSLLEAGDSTVHSPGLPEHRYAVFPVKLDAGQTAAFYLRIKTTAATTMPVYLYSHQGFQGKDHRDQLVYGLLFGTMLAFVFYFSWLALRMRNPSCFWFALYIGMLGLLVATRKGFIQEWLWSGLCNCNNIMNIVVIGLLYFWGAKLLRTFLNVKLYSRKVDRILLVLQWMGLFYIPMALFPNPLTALYSLIMVGAGPVFSTTVSIYYWAKGVPNAKYFAIGWLLGHLTSVLDLMRILGVAPYTPFIAAAMPLSLVSSLVFFTMAIIEQTSTYQFLADQDPLTGLANRRHLDQVLDMEWNRNLRHGRPLSLIMADVDFFKLYNDTYGHKAGDECLRTVAAVLKSFARRPGDLAARYGGEEFLLVLSEAPAEDAARLAEEVRTAVKALGLPHRASKVEPVVTVSLGVATAIPNVDSDPGSLLQAADQAMYQAKRDGRNKSAKAAAL